LHGINTLVIDYALRYRGICLYACNIGIRLVVVVVVVMNTKMRIDIKMWMRMRVNGVVGDDNDEHENDERYDKAFVHISL
jgi:hypothetical protein